MSAHGMVTKGTPHSADGERAVSSMADPPLVKKGRRLVHAASDQGFSLRLLGGVAIWIRAREETRQLLGRRYPDLDLVAHQRDSRRLRALLEALGYVPQAQFNAQHGAHRLLYHAPDSSHHVDVFLDRFEMSHVLDLGARLEVENETIPAAELVLTKLQVAQLTSKDVSDTVMLLLDHSPSGTDGHGQLNASRMAEVCAADWGFFTTVADNLSTVLAVLGNLGLGENRVRLAKERVSMVKLALDNAPKTFRWKARAKLGRRIRWYELPEEIT